MIGQTLGHYVVESRLGQGGMGVVYRARDVRLDRLVALKVLAEEVTTDPERRRRFVREAKAAAAVTHPAIAQIYDVGEADGVIFIAMELVEGRTVRQMVGTRDVDLLGAMDIAIQIGGGLSKAHEAGIVHRDIKSDNVMVTPDGQAKLLDFGLAKLVDPESSSEARTEMPTRGVSTTQTQAGMVLGTLAYMSPEQARGRVVDQRSDIFSLGVMLYEMSTGQMPFAGESMIDTMHAIAFEEARPVTEIRPGLPPGLQRVVARCLRKRPEDRYQTSRELVDDLRRLRHDTESGSIRPLSLSDRVRERVDTLRQRSTGSTLWVVAVVVLLALVVVLIASQENRLGTVLLAAAIGLLLYRRIRNRRRTLVRKLVARLKKMPAVRLVSLNQNELVIVVDEAPATFYTRIHDMVDGINRKLFYGEPLTSRVQHDVPALDLARILQQSGVLYVRPDVYKLARTTMAGAAPTSDPGR